MSPQDDRCIAVSKVPQELVACSGYASSGLHSDVQENIDMYLEYYGGEAAHENAQRH
jgi:hypothetical protein